MTVLVTPRRVALGLAIGCVALLLGAPTLNAQAPPPDSAAAPTTAAPATAPNYSGYQALLDEFVVVLSPPGAPIETGFSYDALIPRADRNERLKVIRDQLLAAPPSKLDPAARKAWAINTYNYLVIETVVRYMYVGLAGRAKVSKAFMVHRKTASVQDIRLPRGKFFESPIVDIEGESYSLDRFERHFLFADFDRNGAAKPPATLDPRVHFAIVCASRGCPPLLPRAYHPDSLDSQLDFAVRNALAQPRHLRWEDPDRLMGSAIFQWYDRDFGGSAASLALIKRYAPQPMVAKIEAAKLPWLSGFLLWDWSYNNSSEKSSGPVQTDKAAPADKRGG